MSIWFCFKLSNFYGFRALFSIFIVSIVINNLILKNFIKRCKSNIYLKSILTIIQLAEVLSYCIFICFFVVYLACCESTFYLVYIMPSLYTMSFKPVTYIVLILGNLFFGIDRDILVLYYYQILWPQIVFIYHLKWHFLALYSMIINVLVFIFSITINFIPKQFNFFFKFIFLLVSLYKYLFLKLSVVCYVCKLNYSILLLKVWCYIIKFYLNIYVHIFSFKQLIFISWLAYLYIWVFYVVSVMALVPTISVCFLIQFYVVNINCHLAYFYWLIIYIIKKISQIKIVVIFGHYLQLCITALVGLLFKLQIVLAAQVLILLTPTLLKEFLFYSSFKILSFYIPYIEFIFYYSFILATHLAIIWKLILINIISPTFWRALCVILFYKIFLYTKMCFGLFKLCVFLIFCYFNPVRDLILFPISCYLYIIATIKWLLRVYILWITFTGQWLYYQVISTGLVGWFIMQVIWFGFYLCYLYFKIWIFFFTNLIWVILHSLIVFGNQSLHYLISVLSCLILNLMNMFFYIICFDYIHYIIFEVECFCFSFIYTVNVFLEWLYCPYLRHVVQCFQTVFILFYKMLAQPCWFNIQSLLCYYCGPHCPDIGIIKTLNFYTNKNVTTYYSISTNSSMSDLLLQYHFEFFNLNSKLYFNILPEMLIKFNNYNLTHQLLYFTKIIFYNYSLFLAPLLLTLFWVDFIYTANYYKELLVRITTAGLVHEYIIDSEFICVEDSYFLVLTTLGCFCCCLCPIYIFLLDNYQFFCFYSSILLIFFIFISCVSLILDMGINFLIVIRGVQTSKSIIGCLYRDFLFLFIFSSRFIVQNWRLIVGIIIWNESSAWLTESVFFFDSTAQLFNFNFFSTESLFGFFTLSTIVLDNLFSGCVLIHNIYFAVVQFCLFLYFLLVFVAVLYITFFTDRDEAYFIQNDIK